MSFDRLAACPANDGPVRRLDRRAALRSWAAMLAGAALARPLSASAAELSTGPLPVAGWSSSLTAADRPVDLAISSEAVQLQTRYDPVLGRYSLASLTAFDTAWVPPEAEPLGALWIDGVQVSGQESVTIDGAGGLELVERSRTSITLRHRDSGLRIALQYRTESGNAIICQATLVNGRRDGDISIASAATVALPLLWGDWTEALGADDAPGGWTLLRSELPASYGTHGLRNAAGGVYPLVRLVGADGSGLIAAVSTATAWRVDVSRSGDVRRLLAGEYESDLVLRPGGQARLPEVVLIFYQAGVEEANDALHRYLASVSAPPPDGWEAVPPVIFNTWYAYGIDLRDDGSGDSYLRQAARLAASVGVEVFVVDAGWYLGSPIPEVVGDRGQGIDRRPRPQDSAPQPDPIDDEGEDNGSPPIEQGTAADEFNLGLGTWIENPRKWQARRGDGGSRASGLRNFSDYVRSLDVWRPDGTSAGKMRFGLWVEPERFDPDFRGKARVSSKWALRGTTVLDLTRSEVVDGIVSRLQRLVSDYRLDYLKIDANLDVPSDQERHRVGHSWTLWSQGFEQVLDSLRTNNPELYLEHCASGLKRYWIGLPRLVHATWLDDDVGVDNVGTLLDATDALMLPRQKTVFSPEQLADWGDGVGNVVQTYGAFENRDGGSIGFSCRLDQCSQAQLWMLATAVDTWKREVRG